MDTRAFFHGRFLNAVDAKGRVSLPADMRGVIAARAREAAAAAGHTFNDRDLMVAVHRDLPCLKGFDMGFLPTLHMQAEETVAHLTGAERILASELAHGAFGDIEKTSFDEPGRMVLPPASRGLVEIEGMALFVGVGLIFHIWNPDTYLACEHIAEFDKRAVRALIATRGAR